MRRAALFLLAKGIVIISMPALESSASLLTLLILILSSCIVRQLSSLHYSINKNSYKVIQEIEIQLSLRLRFL